MGLLLKYKLYVDLHLCLITPNIPENIWNELKVDSMGVLGLNVNGSGHTDGSWWCAQTLMSILVPLRMWCPAKVVVVVVQCGTHKGLQCDNVI